MTSPATNPGTVARGAVPAGAPDGPVNLTALRDTTTNTYAGAVVLDVIRDDRAGVTLPTAIQSVGGDQLVAGSAGQGDQGGEAGEHTISVDLPADPVHASPCADLTHADARSAS